VEAARAGHIWNEFDVHRQSSALCKRSSGRLPTRTSYCGGLQSVYLLTETTQKERDALVARAREIRKQLESTPTPSYAPELASIAGFLIQDHKDDEAREVTARKWLLSLDSVPLARREAAGGETPTTGWGDNDERQ
jgi:hypothetical protein